jgi:HK97 family phage portal protein
MIGDTAVSNTTYINEYSAMTIPAFYSGVSFLTGTLASFRTCVYQDTGSERTPAKHSVNKVLGRSMNGFSTPFQTLQTWYHHAVVWGNGYLWVKRDSNLNPIAMLNLNPEITVPFIYAGQKWFYVNFEKPLILPATDVCHIALVGFDGVRGYPLVQVMRQSLEVGKYAERYSANYFKKGSFVKGAIEVPGTLSDAQFATMRDSLQAFKGIDGGNALELMILQANAKLNNSTIPNETSQLIETRKWSVIEVSQMLRLPPHILYETTGKWSSVQQMGDELVKYTFESWITQIEQEFSAKLLTDAEQDQGYYIRVGTDKLVKADKATYAQTILSLVNGGLMLPNVGCAELEIPSLGTDGDKLRLPSGGNGAVLVNQVDAPGAPTADDDSEADPSADDAPQSGTEATAATVDTSIDEMIPGANTVDPNARPASYAAVLEPLILDAVSRIETKEDKAFADRVTTEPQHRIPWGNVFAEKQSQFLKSAFAPLEKVAIHFDRTIDVDRLANRYSDAIKRRTTTNTKESLIELANEVVYGPA